MMTIQFQNTVLFFRTFLLVFCLSGCALQEPDSNEHEDVAGEEGNMEPCERGDEGCACDARGMCTDDLICRRGICQNVQCEDGMEGCPCEFGALCDGALVCEEDMCISKLGKENGPCFFNRTCLQGLVCNGENRCQACEQGTLGCDCLPNGTCAEDFSCEAGRCASDEVVQQIPLVPECFTPCKRGFLDADTGEYRSCSADGLMRGCIGDAECIEGSCVLPLEEVPGCEQDLDCPDHQVCIQGQCYSNCTIDEDCGGALKCYRHSCRVPCSSAEDICDDGEYCSLLDGDRGYCLPLARPKSGVPRQAVEGHFEISEQFLSFTNLATEKIITITNHSPRRLDFTLSKIEHFEYNDDGLQRIRKQEDENGNRTSQPMPWLEMGTGDETSLDDPQVFSVEGNGGFLIIKLSNVGEFIPKRWEGVIEISQELIGSQRIELEYTEVPDGRWSGQMYYFSQFGEVGVDEWTESRDEIPGCIEPEGDIDRGEPGTCPQADNALINRWTSMRRGSLSFDQFMAVLTSTVNETWKWQSIRDACGNNNNGECYPFDGNQNGIVSYTEDVNRNPIPSGVMELPIALDLKLDEENPLRMRGKIASSESLHYVGNPAVELAFSTSPLECQEHINEEGVAQESSTGCFAFVDSMSATSVVGGRYLTHSRDGSCNKVSVAEDGEQYFELTGYPWLVPGFIEGTNFDPETSRRFKYECRDSLEPFGPEEEVKMLNSSVSSSNPIPDGVSRVRHLELIDGMMINQDKLFLLFKEHFESFLPSLIEDRFSAYGVMILVKTPTTLETENEEGEEVNPFEGTQQGQYANRESEVALSDGSGEQMGQACDPDLISRILRNRRRNPSNVAEYKKVLRTLMDGIVPENGVPMINTNSVHYLCHEIGIIDGGNMEGNVRTDCPAGSEVTYFIGNGLPNTSSLDCQNDGSCGELFEQWQEEDSGRNIRVLIPHCNDENERFCDANRNDLRVGKKFYAPSAENAEPIMEPLESGVANAFRYKTQFRNRQGRNIGFTPEMCAPGSTAIPYCYDPVAIEDLQDRVDCILELYREGLDLLRMDDDDDTELLIVEMNNYLLHHFSYSEENNNDLADPVIHDGFEKLFAELSVMLGDDAYTAAFRSRFDLAGSSLATFEGSKLEPGGIDLSGVAGYEMYKLYQATQYYRMVLDRFYKLSPYIAFSLSENRVDFIGGRTVTTYFQKVLRASSQLARAWSEIGKRYQNFNRADLARFAVERAYNSTYIESVVIAKLMVRVIETVDRDSRDEVVKALDKAALTYKAALLDMREVYADFTDEINYFGFPVDYIPMPALVPGGPNAFETLIRSAQEATQVAAAKEDLAIANNRSYETDSASFQAELTRIETNYENQLAELCGTFEGNDGRIYPAIRKYAYLNSEARLLGEPCGLMGNGLIWEKVGSLELSKLAVLQNQQALDRVEEEIEIEVKRINAQCDLVYELADFRFQINEERSDIEKEIQKAKRAIDKAQRTLSMKAKLADLATCVVGLSTDCPTKIVAAASYAVVSAMTESEVGRREDSIEEQNLKLEQLEQEQIQFETLQQCDVMRVDSDATIAQRILSIREITLEALQTDYAIRLADSEISKLINQAKRISAEQEEMEQLVINVEAARNDPNVRIYKNDAVINADKAFYAALKQAYRATKVFEYYTSQSYAQLVQLSLVRMASRGDYNLENYLRELSTEYEYFLEEYGRPDLRVDVLSTLNDVLVIPRYGEDGQVLNQGDRVGLFREKLTDVKMFDGRGYLTLPFSTSARRLSPLTRNHKIAYIEAELIGSSVGDNVGRVYLEQSGTGTIKPVEGFKQYYRFPERTAVVNPFYNGVRVFPAEVYRNERLRDRPYSNTYWELIFNQRDELANQDIDLGSLTDIRLYIYYTDFTAF